VASDLKRHLQPMLDLIQAHPTTRLLVIVDGYDSYARFRDNLAGALRDIYSPAQYRRIVGLRKAPSDSGDSRLGSTGLMVLLRTVPVEDEDFKLYVSSFASALPGDPELLSERLLEAVSRLDLLEADLFTLNLLFSSGIQQGRQVDSIASLLKAYCREYLERAFPSQNQSNESLSRAAEVAFRLKYTDSEPVSETEELPVFLELMNRHPRISDFLIATHVLDEIYRTEEGAEVNRNRLGHVFTYSVNRIAKELIPKRGDFLANLYDGLVKIVDDTALGPYTKAHACYLLGRMTNGQYIGLAKTKLKSLMPRARELAEESRNTDLESQHLLLLRTIYISLTYLGDETSEDEYIGHLLSKSRWDDINRGFHLEYYEDQEYDSNAPLVNTDYLGPYPKTFARLYEKLRQQSHPRSYEIDLHTFCSLAQHRHAIGMLDDSYRVRTIEIIDQSLDADLLRTDELRKYLVMLRRHLGFEHFRVGYIFNDFYHIKFVKRKGWVSRDILNGENVSDHMYGAYLMAMFLLPDQVADEPEYAEYSKPKVMQMLLIHDLAEARTGDFLPGERTDEARRKEEEVFGDIAMLGTYSGMAVLRDVAALWEEYQAGISVNARVAKEIDKLENLMQLWVYRAADVQIKDFDTWDKSMRAKVRTDPGRHVLQKLREFMQNSSGELTHGLRVDRRGAIQHIYDAGTETV
jgi:5'-deoxynucleotidase YfbR-like HD superfamily hydrolase